MMINTRITNLLPFFLRVYVYMHTRTHMHEVHARLDVCVEIKGKFAVIRSPSTMCILGMKVILSNLASASALTD